MMVSTDKPAGDGNHKKIGLYGILLSQMLSLLGISLTGFGLPILLYQKSGNVSELGLMYFFQLLPGTLALIPAGSMVDRFSCRSFATVSIVAYMLNLIYLAWSYQQHGLTPSSVYLYTGILSLVGALQGLSLSALFAENSKGELRTFINMLMSLKGTIPRLCAPALAGILIAHGQFIWLMVIDFSFQVLFLIALIALTSGFDSRPARKSDSVNYLEASSIICKSTSMRRSLLSLVATNVTTCIIGVYMIPIATSFSNAELIGYNFTMAGLGGIFGTIAYRLKKSMFAADKVPCLTHALQGVSLGLMVLTQAYLYFGVFLFFYFFMMPIQNGFSYSCWQDEGSPGLYGRLSAVKGTTLQLSSMGTFLISGYLVDKLLKPLVIRFSPTAESFQVMEGILLTVAVIHIIASMSIFKPSSHRRVLEPLAIGN